MGLIKKIFGLTSRAIDNGTFQERASWKVDKMLKGEKVAAPKYKSEEKLYEKYVKDKDLEEKMGVKDEKLIENLNKFEIRSSEIENNTKCGSHLPTRETEWEHKNDKTWEYFFYEPSKEKMLPNRLTLRETLEVLRSKYQLSMLKSETSDAALKIKEELKNHDAVKRIDEEKMTNIWKHFRPFARSDEQKVVRNADLAHLQDVMNRRINDGKFFDLGKTDPKTIQTIEGREKAKQVEAAEIKAIEERRERKK
uniref:39S ribosomal protein L59, mitochondrial n=1 Tax=Rhabditophanes sp. KR3021 TaxID=114890 RepID=A0AC35UI46_9BILA